MTTAGMTFCCGPGVESTGSAICEPTVRPPDLHIRLIVLVTDRHVSQFLVEMALSVVVSPVAYARLNASMAYRVNAFIPSAV